METARLKNIIILTLALVNVFLLGTLGMRRAQQIASQHQAAEALIAIFAADQVSLSESAISFDSPPSALTLERETAREQALAAAFLGNSLTSANEGGGIVTYTSDSGQAVFRASGAFEITGDLGENAALLCQQFCRDYGCEPPETWFAPLGSGSVTAQQLYQGYTVENAAVTFVAENDVLRSVSGILLPAESAPAQSGALLSASSALTAFLNARRTSGTVVSSVTAAYLCYELQNNAAIMTLTPTWCIVTDTVNYYVNCSTGAVTHA